MITKDSFSKFIAATEHLNGGLLGISPIVWRSFFPRSICGQYQDDPIVRAILTTAPNKQISKLSHTEVVELVSKITTPVKQRNFATRPCLVNAYFETFVNSNPSDFIGLIAHRLKFLESHRPTDRDFAIEELQNACVGLWGLPLTPGLYPPIPSPNWPPTKKTVTTIAEQRLRRRGRRADFNKSSWSGFLKKADRYNELIEGKAGRPQSVNENMKAARELKALITKHVNKTYRGDFKRALEVLKPAIGTRADSLREERERLRAGTQDQGEADLQ